MNRRQVLATGSLGVALVASQTQLRAAYRRQDPAGTPAVPDPATFEDIVSPTPEDQTRISLLASVTRNTWGPVANLGGTCFDIFTGGPRYVIVEDGLLRVSTFDPQAPATTSPDVIVDPTVFLVEDDHAPLPAPPVTRLELQSGDAIVFPDGAKCGMFADERDSPAVFLEVTMLPGSPSSPTVNDKLEMTGEVLEIGFGDEAGEGVTPPVVVTGRLRIEAGDTLVLEDIAMALAFFVESGEVTLNVLEVGALARATSFTEADSSMAVPPGTDLNLVPGNYAYIPATVTGTMSAATPVSCLVLALDFTITGGEE